MNPLPPRVFHLADPANFDSIRADGLLPARALIERAIAEPGRRNDLLRRQRLASHELPDGSLLRDQRPLPARALARCLAPGVTPADWYEHLNNHVFFWLRASSADNLQAAYGKRPQWRLTIDTARLLARHGASAFVTPINTGYALRDPAPRSIRTFVPYAEWQRTGWAHEGRARRPGHPPMELAFACAIPDLAELDAEPPTLIAPTVSNP